MRIEDKIAEAFLKKIKDKGEIWAASAMVDGSIGYYSASIALKIVRKFVETRVLYGGAGKNAGLLQERSLPRNGI
jgi:hypothetical protein